jgi:uncharacterized protein
VTSTEDSDVSESSPSDSARDLELDQAFATKSPIAKPTVLLRWGPWATLGWTLLCILVLDLTQFGVLAFCSAIWDARTDSNGLKSLLSLGNVFALAAIFSTSAVIGVVVGLITARRRSIREYLALRMPSSKRALLSIGGLALIAGVCDLVTYELGREIVAPVTIQIFRSASLPLLLVALLVAAPLGEEVLFRGFLFGGIASSKWGTTAAILISSCVWALLHFSLYDWYGVTQVGVIGMYLGYLRKWTGSLPLTILLQGLLNAWATVEMALVW